MRLILALIVLDVVLFGCDNPTSGQREKMKADTYTQMCLNLCPKGLKQITMHYSGVDCVCKE